MKYGCLMMDHAEFRPKWKLRNKGATGFLLAVEVLSQQLMCEPVKNKSLQEWKNAIERMLPSKIDGIHTIISDRDSVATSKNFRNWIKEKYNIDWDYLRSRSKAFLAERYIRFIKSRLSAAIKANPKDLNWIQYLPPVLQDFNSKNVTGTDIPRNSIDRFNWMKLVEARLGISDASSFVNISDFGDPHKTWADKIFKYKRGDRVLLSRKADYKRGQTFTSKTFEKPSVSGAYSDFVYTITSRRLKHVNKWALTKVYSLSGLEGYFYESELIPALFDP